MAHRRGTTAERHAAAQHSSVSRRAMRERLHFERQREAERRHRNARLQLVGLLSGGLVALLLAVLLGIHALTNTISAQQPIPGVVTYTNLSRDHTTAAVTYAQNPPVGGTHDPVWQNCGIYTSPVRSENVVHSLEHGAVWITYRPDLSSSAIQRLQSLIKGSAYTLLAPYPGLPAPVVASAWGLQMQVQSTTDSRLAQFIDRYADGPQAPEPGGECTGGVGTPQ